MTQLETQDPIYRTSPERTYKMMAIMLGICIVGGGIFFGMWDYWISMPPPAANLNVGADDHGGAEAGSVGMNSETPDSSGFNGFVAAAISLPGMIPSKPSSSAVTPNEWKDFPAFTTSNTILSPTFAVIVGLLPDSPGKALNANILKSLLSTNDNDIGISTPDAVTGATL